MNRKSLIVLVVIAVVVAVLAVLGQRTGSLGDSGDSSVGELLVPGLAQDLDNIEQVVLLKAGGEAAVTLDRAETGWAVEQQDGYPADISRLREALIALSEARIVEEKTSNPDFYDRLAVEPIELDSAAGTAVRISVPDKSYPDVILGGTAGSSSRFARRADEATSVLVDQDPFVPTDSTQWLRPDLVDIRSDRVQRVEISHADGERLVIEKPSRDARNFTVTDVPEGRELQYETVANVTGNALRELRLEGARATTDGPEPAATTEFWTFDGLVVTARTYDIDAERWVDFAARFDANQALEYATEPVEEGVAAAEPADEQDPEQEAESINARLAGWRFRIPAHINDQMTRRMDDLLRDVESE